MARIASGRSRAFLFVAVLLPLWSSYLIRVYIWRLILNEDGVLNWTLGKRRAAAPPPRVHELGGVDRLLVRLAAVHDPAGLRRARAPPRTRCIEASRDLGARRLQTFRRVVLPLALPGVIAGSIFTFSLTLGDYVTPLLAGGAGHAVHRQRRLPSVGISNNVPFAAAFATIPLVVMAVYLLIARRLGAFEAMCGATLDTVGARPSDGARHPFLWMPLGLIMVYAFNSRTSRAGRSRASRRTGSASHGTHRRCATRSGSRVRAALLATGTALVLGSRPRSRLRASASSAARRSRSCSSCRSRCPGSSPAWRSTRSSSSTTSTSRSGRS